MELAAEGVKPGIINISSAKAHPPRSLAGDVARRLLRHRFAVFGLVVLGAVILLVAVGPLVYTTSPTTVDFAAALEGPSRAHLLGTNDLGQDTLARDHVWRPGFVDGGVGGDGACAANWHECRCNCGLLWRHGGLHPHAHDGCLFGAAHAAAAYAGDLSLPRAAGACHGRRGRHLCDNRRHDWRAELDVAVASLCAPTSLRCANPNS